MRFLGTTLVITVVLYTDTQCLGRRVTGPWLISEKGQISGQSPHSNRARGFSPCPLCTTCVSCKSYALTRLPRTRFVTPTEERRVCVGGP